MERGTADELDATLLGARLPVPPALKAMKAFELCLHLVAFVGVIAAIILDGHSDNFDPSRVIGEVKHYHWRTTTADAALGAFVAVFTAGACALGERPLFGLVASLLVCGAAVAKRIQLVDHTAGALRSWCVVSAAVATACASLATLLQSMRLRRRRRALAMLRLDHDLDLEGTSSTSFHGAGLPRPNTYARHGSDGSSKGASVGRLMSLAAPESCMLIFATILLLGSTATSTAMPAMVGGLLNSVTSPKSGKPFDDLGRVTLELIIIFAIGSILNFGRGYLFSLAGERVVARLRAALFCQILSLEIGFFDAENTGELLNRLSSDTTVLQSACTLNISMGLRFAGVVLVALAACFFLSWSLTLVMLAIVPAIAIAAVLYGLFLKRIGKQYQARLADAGKLAQEKIGAMRTVRSFAMEHKELESYHSSVQYAYEMGAKRALAYGSFVGLMTLVGQSAIILVLWYGGTLVLRDRDVDNGFNAGKLMSFLLYTVMIAGGLGGLSGLFSSLMNAVGSSERIFELFDRVSAIRNVGGTVLPDLHGVLQLRDVSFAYPSRPDVLVLDRVSLTIQPGSVLALVGPSGSGKSSVIALIERFYDPQSGSLLIDGVPLTDLDASWWRRQAALVAQEPVLFASSIHDNITYGCAAVTHDAVVAAARTANAHSFISAFPDAYGTMVGERGVQLSGGQKQRIAIARALLVDPRMLLLDEATSALDAESEHVVQEAVDRLMQNRTTVVVAHRLSTISSADTICVVQRGRIAERGTHETLLALDGVYRMLVARQLGGEGGGTGSSPPTRHGSELDIAAAGKGEHRTPAHV